MTEQHFQKQMDRLIEGFGGAEYNRVKLELIWDTCQDLPDRVFTWIIKHFLETRSVKYPPLPTHFHEAAVEQRKLLDQQGLGNRRSAQGEVEWSNTPIKEIMKKLGGTSALEALEKQIQKNQDAEK